ncbi:Formin-like protein, partial [Drosera capensis]
KPPDGLLEIVDRYISGDGVELVCDEFWLGSFTLNVYEMLLAFVEDSMFPAVSWGGKLQLVFDCCFTIDAVEDENYKEYIGGIANQLRVHLPDASFMAFNFHGGDKQSELGVILSEYDMTVMDYPRQYEGCPLLTMEMIRHFLKSCESWLSLGQQNVLLMHCERGGWPILAFMLAALLIYSKQCTGEQKTLDMIHKQAPRELLQLISPLNPMPSQLRYLQYVSRKNVGSEWPPRDRALTLDCIILRVIPNMDGEGGCRPILKIYGEDPFLAGDQTPKVLFSTPRKNKVVRNYKQVDCELVKLDIHCHVQGDVVLECINLEDDLEREKMMFRVMFNTAFIRSNILMLNRDEIDTLWKDKDLFPREFRAEVLFSEMDSAPSTIPVELSPGMGEKEGLPVEAFAKVQELFSSVDWLDPKADMALNVLQQITVSSILREKLEIATSKRERHGSLDSLSPKDLEAIKSLALGSSPTSVCMVDHMPSPADSTNSIQKLDGSAAEVASTTPLKDSPSSLLAKNNRQKYTSMALDDKEPSVEQSLSRMKDEPQDVLSSATVTKLDVGSSERLHSESNAVPDSDELKEQVEPLALDRCPRPTTMESGPSVSQPIQTMIISSRRPRSSHSSPSLYVNPLQGSSVPLTRYHTVSSSLGITAVLHDLASYQTKDAAHLVENHIPPIGSSVISIPEAPKRAESSVVSPVPASSSPTVSAPPLPPPPPSLPPTSPAARSPPESIPLPSNSSCVSIPESSGPMDDNKLESSSPPVSNKVVSPSPPSHMHPGPNVSPSSSGIAPKFSSPPPPPPPSPPSLPHSGTSPSPGIRSSVPPPPPPLPKTGSSALIVDSISTSSIRNSSTLGPPLPPPLPKSAESGPSSCPSNIPSVPPPPPIPRASTEVHALGQGSSPRAPPAPPPPGPSIKALSKSNVSSQQPNTAGSNGPVPPAPGPLVAGKGRGPSSLTSRSQGSSKRTSLKPYHWLKLTRVVQGSLWAEAQRYDEASRAPEFDRSELERLFATSVSNSDKESPGGKYNRRASGPKSEKVQLIELRRANNCEIMLSKVKIPLPDLMSSVLALDDSALDVDQVENLIKFCPTKEEMELLKGYTGDREKLGRCEQIRNSVKLRRIMQTILSLGNALNHGTARGSAVGFRLDSLLKLTDTRARNNKMTLMHYLCKVLAEKLPELLDFPEDLPGLEASTKIQLKFLAEEMQAISKGLEKVVQELTASENDGPISQNFCNTLKNFLALAEGEVRSLASLYSN